MIDDSAIRFQIKKKYTCIYIYKKKGLVCYIRHI